KSRFHKRSDIDIAVKGIDDELFYEAYGEIIGKYTDFKVDLIDMQDCKESLLTVIQKEGKEI
ncbi:MAG: nucleotidyltransferase domain-containing protein, partial [Bacillota bacterium]